MNYSIIITYQMAKIYMQATAPASLPAGQDPLSMLANQSKNKQKQENETTPDKKSTNSVINEIKQADRRQQQVSDLNRYHQRAQQLSHLNQ